MKKPSEKEIQKALNALVGIKFLECKDDKYKFHPNYKKTLLKCKGNSKEEILIDALIKSGYFVVPKTSREVNVVINLLLLGGK